MIVHPKTIGIIACCGSECTGGYISRAVAARVVNELRATKVVALSLPRLLIGTANEKRFSMNHPTITLDGCAKACARKAVEKYCFKPIVGINIGDLIGEQEVLASVNGAHRYMSEIDKVSGIVTHVLDSVAAMYEKAKAAQNNNCDEGTCDCGCGGSSCGCGCESGSKDAPVSDQTITSEPNRDGIVIYTKTGCPFCAKVLQDYREKGIAFQEVNTSVHDWAKNLCKDRYGSDKVPVIVKDGVAIQIGDVEGKG
ncbi:glutaredoxin [Sporomusa sp. KB1]|jgi:glutaredoxin/uncharacterized metal-binding protein|nr:putative zinc-binding protein [Sporomusa sp. KB1]TWH45607.1 glutaredoxin [Sporomusa sp. KB1]